MRPGDRTIQLDASLEILLVRHSDKPLQGFDFVFLGLDDGLLRGGFALGLAIGDRPQAGLEFVSNVCCHQRHFIDHLLFVMKPRKGCLELLVEPFEPVE